MLPSFLGLPHRPPKPRAVGVTHVLDKGLSIHETHALVDQAGHAVDIVKVGWGIGYVDPNVRERSSIYTRAGIDVCLGGTLLEVAAARGKIGPFHAWALEIGVTMIEVSNGLGLLSREAKTGLISRLGRDFLVAAEVGSKDPASLVVAGEWAEEMESDLVAGATWVVAEGRESGTVGLYQSDGRIRDEVVDALLERIPLDRVIFEAPNKSQQSWFIQSLGADVNLGNIPSDEVLPLETLRLGLRADTSWMAVAPRSVGASS